MNNLAALIGALLCASALAQIDGTVCKPYSGTSKPMPSLPKGYSVRTELNIVTSNFTIEVYEYYDESEKMSAYEVVDYEEEVYAILNFNTNELIYIEPAEEGVAKTCEVSDLKKNMPKMGTQTTESKIIRLKDAMEYGNGSPTSFSKGVLRGEKVQIWKACVYDSAWGATFDVTWYFSDEWKTVSGTIAAPIRVHLVGKAPDKDGKVSNHERIYDFSDWNPAVPDRTAFELHSGTYCKNLKQKKPVPETPMYFSYGIETVSMGAGENIRSDLYIVYNQLNNLFRMDYIELNKDGDGYGDGPLSQIHDFNAGVSYRIAKNKGTCDIALIESLGEDTTSVDSTHVRMKTSKEFFGLNKKNYMYQGERSVRGIDCDVWIDSRTDWPKNASDESLWEWSFSNNEVLADSDGTTEPSFPVKLEIRMPSGNANAPSRLYNISKTVDEIHIVQNIYGVEEGFQSYERFDINMCFGVDQRFDYQFAIHGSFKKIIQNKEQQFKDAVRLQLSIGAGISPLRITHIKVDYDSEDVIVYFSLLGLPGVEGDVKRVSRGNNLEDATTRLAKLIATKGLSIDLGHGTTVPFQQDTYQRIVNINQTVKKGKYKPGDMAGIGLGMLLVGIVVGGLLTRYIVKKKMEDKFKAVRFDSQMET